MTPEEIIKELLIELNEFDESIGCKYSINKYSDKIKAYAREMCDKQKGICHLEHVDIMNSDISNVETAPYPKELQD